jgi:NADP-dependent 3-hydroxy acid dehydrogenase YdfG
MKVVVITGSTRGIGHGMAIEFLKRGCQVMLSGRSQKNVDAEVQQLAKQYGADKVSGKACEVVDFKQVQSLWDAAKNSFGRVDIWINNAGVTHTTKHLAEMDIEEIKPVIDTNVTGMIYGSKIALQGMLKQGFGQIYNMEGHGSNDSKLAGVSVYGTSKRALRYLTEVLIDETEDTPVQVCFLSPGIVLTDFLINGMRKRPAEELESVKAILNCLADTVETVTPFLVENILKNDKHGVEIAWLTEEKANERLNSDEYYNRDLFSQYGL